MQPGDSLDNDCDGKIDEEVRDRKDNDGDGQVDEDLELVSYNWFSVTVCLVCLPVCLSDDNVRPVE